MKLWRSIRRGGINHHMYGDMNPRTPMRAQAQYEREKRNPLRSARCHGEVGCERQQANNYERRNRHERTSIAVAQQDSATPSQGLSRRIPRKRQQKAEGDGEIRGSRKNHGRRSPASITRECETREGRVPGARAQPSTPKQRGRGKSRGGG